MKKIQYLQLLFIHIEMLNSECRGHIKTLYMGRRNIFMSILKNLFKNKKRYIVVAGLSGVLLVSTVCMACDFGFIKPVNNNADKNCGVVIDKSNCDRNNQVIAVPEKTVTCETEKNPYNTEIKNEAANKTEEKASEESILSNENNCITDTKETEQIKNEDDTLSEETTNTQIDVKNDNKCNAQNIQIHDSETANINEQNAEYKCNDNISNDTGNKAETKNNNIKIKESETNTCTIFGNNAIISRNNCDNSNSIINNSCNGVRKYIYLCPGNNIISNNNNDSVQIVEKEVSEDNNDIKEDNKQSNTSYVDEVIRLVNVERAKYNLPSLVKDSSLCNVAEIRANEIVSNFSHTRPNGKNCFTVLSENGISYRTCGENIAYGQRTPEEVVNAWMNSEGHRENILKSSYTRIGVGAVNVSGVYYWSQMFAG